MTNVFWPAHDLEFIPSSLTRVPFDSVTVDLDTSKHYVQVWLYICTFRLVTSHCCVHHVLVGSSNLCVKLQFDRTVYFLMECMISGQWFLSLSDGIVHVQVRQVAVIIDSANQVSHREDGCKVRG